MDGEELRKRLTLLPVEESAAMLLGARLVTPVGSCQIVEVEAYSGSQDPGSHAFRGETPRNRAMFGPSGHLYTYFVYGSSWMLNLTAGPAGVPAAILIRAAIPLDNLDAVRLNRPRAKSIRDLANGPGKICAAYGIGAAEYGLDALDPDSRVHILPDKQAREVIATPRIGLAVGKGHETPWRFVDAGAAQWASRRSLP
ncbi:MAG: DNA-3-methyladenine glycosylase [Armatimonadetes bacterium]|nr:DNA-3-methyladenine glycosylase [Armatimonadota bacterium]MBX3109407.1 DNA-3-methyladenine glycosylase [Fimbriimonadaceae bacterium]